MSNKFPASRPSTLKPNIAHTVVFPSRTKVYYFELIWMYAFLLTHTVHHTSENPIKDMFLGDMVCVSCLQWLCM